MYRSCRRPTFIFFVLATITQLAVGREWPYNLPPHQKYWPEHEALLEDWPEHDALVRRHAKVAERMERQQPTGMRKMSGDPDEMFFPEYWSFEDDQESTWPSEDILLELPFDLSTDGLRGNTTMNGKFLPPFLFHSERQDVPHSRKFPRELYARGFQCPTGTTNCSSIDRPNSCCGNTETCVIITDTGLGDVGCCPDGETCAGDVSVCDTANGYHSCPGSSNGGCCIPDYICQDVGCVANSTSTTFVTSVETLSSFSSTPTPQIPFVTVITTTTFITAGSSTLEAITVTTTVLETQTVPPSTTSPTDITTSTDTVTVDSLTCSTGFQTCASSLGGGCCPTDRACGTGGMCPPVVTETVTQETTITGEAVPPVRPTGNSDSSNLGSVIATITTTLSNSMCPGGYYMCSAFYVGGCCQVGRDCSSTNCPAPASTTIVSGTEIIIVGTGVDFPPSTVVTSVVTSVASNDGTASADDFTTTITEGPGAVGTCYNGWLECGAIGGGGCCPSGYSCGGSCTATIGGGLPHKVAKQAGSQASFLKGWGRGLTVLICLVGAATILL